MSLIVKLLIASLFSIHQYIPEDGGYKKYFTDARHATAEDIIPAAHETCRYMISVFTNAGLDVTLGSNENSALSQALTQIIGGDDVLNSMLENLSSELFKKKFEKNNVDVEDLRTNVLNLCSLNFSPLSYTPAQRLEVFDFIQSEIKVLSDVHLNSLGDFNYFGSVNIFDRSGEMMGTLDAVPRSWVPYEKMSPRLTLALLATEDEDFFEHKGVDSKAIARIVKQLLSGDDAAGGSTVTMQLLKNMYFLNGPASNYEQLNSGSFSTLLRKVREWYWAWPFEKEHAKVLGDTSAKKYVLEMYFNLVDFGPRIQGIEQASYTFFNKSAKNLDLAESAFITTLLKAPSTYSNPDNYVERSEPRRNDYILNRVGQICQNVENKIFKTTSLVIQETYEKICKDGKSYIDTEYVEAAKSQGLPFWLRPTSAPVATAAIHVRNLVRDWVGKYKFDPEKKPKEISVQTTINEPLQKIIFDVVREKIDEYDDARNKDVGSIQPANDDTGKRARFRDSDINSSLKYEISSLISKFSNSDLTYFPSIKFRNSSAISAHTLDFKDITAYLDSKNVTAEDLTNRLEQISKDIKNAARNVGDIYLIEFNNLDYNVISIQDYVNSNPEISVIDAQVALANFDRLIIRNQIIINALERMDRVKPRSYMRVGVVSENGNLINSDLEQVRLFSSHEQRTRRFEFGDFFWLKPEDLKADSQTQAAGTFRLDSIKLQAAVVVMDSNTGEILANFGGYDPLTSSFNRSKDAYRQAGSALKPWIYFYALNKGFNPQNTLNNGYISFKIPGKSRPYIPKNYSNSLNGNLAFAKSLIHSQNIGTYSLIKNPIWGPDWRTNLDELRAFFESIKLYDTADEEVTIMLGSQVVSIEKLVSSFTFFANGSKVANPQYIKYVSDYKGQKLFDIEHSYTEVPVQRSNSVFQIQTLLAEIANSGTAARMNNFVKELSDGKYSQSCYNGVIGPGKQSCIGGKTGTSNGGKDVWFMGFSKNFVIGIWVGYDQPKSIGGRATGGGLAMPIFQEILTQAEQHLPAIEPFVDSSMMPSGLERLTVYGNLACTQGNASSMVIYSDYNSDQNRCSYNVKTQSDSSVTSRPSPEVRSPSPVTANQNSCSCVSDGWGAVINIVYNGKYYSAFRNYSSVSECLQDKFRIKSRAGDTICP